MQSRLRMMLPRLAVVGAGVLALVIVGSVVTLWVLSRGSVVDAGVDDSDSPVGRTVIVPGARVFSSGRPSPALADRLDVAYDALVAGSMDHILVSGDNRTDRYNEPEAMQAYLVDRGVEPGQITMDFAGLDTWDTCIRANKQFGVTEAMFVTQGVYANRAASLCQAAGIDVIVAAVPEPDYGLRRRVMARLRESLASVKAIGDIVRTPASHHEGPFVGLVSSEQQLDEIAQSR